MNSQKLFYTAGQTLTLDEHPARRDIIGESFSSGEIPLNAFIGFCDAHLSLTSVYLKLRKHDLIGLFPPELDEHLEYLVSINRGRNNAILRQVEEINAALEQKNIQPVYLKGVAHLLDGLYGDAGERIIGDIDFLVEEKNYFEAAGILKEIGYKCWWQHGDVPAAWQHGSPNHHYPALIREKDAPAAVELHRIPVSHRHSEKFNAELVFSDKKNIAAQKNCFVPSDAHKIVHNFIHGQLVNSGHRLKTASLRDLYDLYLLSKRHPLKTALHEMREKDREKAMGYFLFTASVLDLNDKFHVTANKKAQRHCFLSRLALQHPRISSFYRKAIKLGSLIFKAYLGTMIKTVYQKSARRHVITRLKAPSWYRAHLKLLKERFWR